METIHLQGSLYPKKDQTMKQPYIYANALLTLLKFRKIYLEIRMVGDVESFM